MRLSLLALTAVAAFAASGCDSTGIDAPLPTPPGNEPGGDGPGGGPAPAQTFVRVDPTATYLRTDDVTPYAVAARLADFGLEPGDTACYKAKGDYFVYDGQLASGTGDPLVTAVFSASDRLTAPSELSRVKDLIVEPGDVVTRPVYTSGADTDIAEDFDATGTCRVVPAGATHVFFSAYDDMFLDNADALAGGEPFGVEVTER